MIFRPSDAEFQVELEGTKKCVHQKCPKDRVSNGKTEWLSWKKEKSQIKPLFRFGTQREQKLIFQTPTSHQALKPVKILKAGTHQRNVGKSTLQL